MSSKGQAQFRHAAQRRRILRDFVAHRVRGDGGGPFRGRVFRPPADPGQVAEGGDKPQLGEIGDELVFGLRLYSIMVIGLFLACSAFAIAFVPAIAPLPLIVLLLVSAPSAHLRPGRRSAARLFGQPCSGRFCRLLSRSSRRSPPSLSRSRRAAHSPNESLISPCWLSWPHSARS